MSTLKLQIPPKLLPIAQNPKRWNDIHGGRGSGKSFGIGSILSFNGYREKRRILCAREFQNSLKESVYDLLCELHERMGLDSFYRRYKDTIVGENGTEFLFKGIRTHDIAKIKSLALVDDCWVEEAQVISEKSWRILIPTIREKGSRFYCTWNPELQDDPTYQRLIESPPKDCQSVVMNYNDNPWFDQTELEQERIADYERDKTHDKHVYKHTWEGRILPAVEGAIFADEVAQFIEDGRYRVVDHDPMGKVYGIMDLGFGVMTMVLAQKFASTAQIIGYREWRNSTYAKITKSLQDDPACKDYRWGSIFMPHDAAHRDPKTGHSHKEVMTNLGWKVEDVPQIGIENYIEKGRMMFDTSYISTENGGDDLMRCLRRFKYKIPADSDANKRMAPDKDDWSHGSEAFCYTAVIADRMVNESRVVKDPYEGFATYAG